MQEFREESTKLKQTTNKISEYIAKQGLKDGDRMPTERELVQILKVGRSTLREALRVLVVQNVLEVRRGVGTFVSYKNGVMDDPLGFAYIRDKKKLAQDLLEFRILIEPRIAALAAQHATTDEIGELEFLCADVDRLILLGESHLRKDQEFHTRIARCSNNLILPKLLPITHQAIDLFITETGSKLLEETMKTHRAVLDAIKNADPIAAHDAMLLHLIYNRDALSHSFSSPDDSLG